MEGAMNGREELSLNREGFREEQRRQSVLSQTLQLNALGPSSPTPWVSLSSNREGLLLSTHSREAILNSSRRLITG